MWFLTLPPCHDSLTTGVCDTESRFLQYNIDMLMDHLLAFTFWLEKCYRKVKVWHLRCVSRMQLELELGCTNQKIQDDFWFNRLATPTKSLSGHKVISHHSLKCVIYIECKHARYLSVKGGQQENIGMCLRYGPYSCIMSEHLQPCGVK